MEEAYIQDQMLDRKLASIRTSQEAGTITTREAADQRIAAMEQHLETTRNLRIEHFGQDAPSAEH